MMVAARACIRKLNSIKHKFDPSSKMVRNIGDNPTFTKECVKYRYSELAQKSGTCEYIVTIGIDYGNGKEDIADLKVNFTHHFI